MSHQNHTSQHKRSTTTTTNNQTPRYGVTPMPQPSYQSRVLVDYTRSKPKTRSTKPINDTHIPSVSPSPTILRKPTIPPRLLMRTRNVQHAVNKSHDDTVQKIHHQTMALDASPLRVKTYLHSEQQNTAGQFQKRIAVYLAEKNSISYLESLSRPDGPQKARFIKRYIKNEIQDPQRVIGSYWYKASSAYDWALFNGVIDVDIKPKMGDMYVDGSSTIVDFANRKVGGGVLSHGSVQEEIMFCRIPELLMLKVNGIILSDCDVIIIRGVRLMYNSTGYGASLQYSNYIRGGKIYEVLVMDATNFNAHNAPKETSKSAINREITKAFVAFSNANGKTITTGNWGCGAFGGNIKVKFLEQVIAAQAANKNLIYVSVTQSESIIISNLYRHIMKEKLTISDIYHSIVTEKCLKW
ncbi:hypothetical protein [Dendrolimus punctatus cypovirus 22]|uniref:hypothetical protein n=1 Tax=Dendrolimus punctatus cypovirus 22 TaxID=1577776 RepID=UPI00053FA4B0|nr:hypothetical protein [Dendrolimus punctatus cypovirus 22]AIY60605.1 hypothetical protein [Dendrolimus punctatus cypovirus 22]